jgi:transposase
MSLSLTDAEQRTLLEMGIGHPHRRTRRRAQGLLRLAQGISQAQLAREYEVHLNSVRYWIMCWETKGVVGLIEGHRSGRPRKFSEDQRDRLRQMAEEEGCNINRLVRPLRDINENHRTYRVSPDANGDRTTLSGAIRW